MYKNPIKKFADTRALVVAGYPSADQRGRAVIDALTKIDNNLSFFGLGGKEMQASKKFISFADLSSIEDKPLYPHNNGEHDLRFILYPPVVKSNYEWYKINKQLKNNGFYEQFENNKDQTDVMVTIGNPLVSARLYSSINRIYEEENRLMPFRIHIDKTSRKFTHKYSEFLDLFFYTIPLAPMNPTSFRFPGRFIGKQVVFDAFSFLYKHTDKFDKLAQENAIYLHPELNTFIMEEVIFNIRNEYRSKYGISDSSTVFYVSLGNTREEIKANGKPVYDALKQFADKYASMGKSSNDFNVILNLPERSSDYEQIIYGFTNSGVNIRIIFGKDERYQAMAASDLGACANGDAVLECAVMQLPIQILDHSHFVKSYISLLYNVYENDINILDNGEVLPELVGRNFAGKIVEFWSEWYESPKHRYKLAVKTNKLLIDFLPKPSTNEQNTSIAVGSDVFTIYSNPKMELTIGLKKALSDYRELKASGLTKDQIANKRDIKLGLGFE